MRATAGGRTDRGEEACEDVRKRRVCSLPPPVHLLIKAARLRTETSYKAGLARRASTTSRSRFRTTDLVNDELVQRNITQLSLLLASLLSPLSGETCKTACESSFAPTSRACLKGWNVWSQGDTGNAGVSRGRSTDPRTPFETGRTER